LISKGADCDLNTKIFRGTFKSNSTLVDIATESLRLYTNLYKSIPQDDSGFVKEYNDVIKILSSKETIKQLRGEIPPSVTLACERLNNYITINNYVASIDCIMLYNRS